MNSNNDNTLPSSIDLIRNLRMAGRAAEAQALIRTLEKACPPDLYIGQLGIDMNYLGMVSESEPLLRRALDDDHSPINRYMLINELTGCLQLQGRYHEAHALSRTFRGNSYAKELIDIVFRGDADAVATVAPKLLGLDEPVEGKRLFVMVEGGLGDFVNFSRYIDQLFLEGAAEVTFEGLEDWLDVIRPREGLRLSPAFHDVRGEELERCDRATFVFDLVARYQTSPYFPVFSPDALVGLDSARPIAPEADALLNADNGQLKVGLIWRSGSTARHEPYRSIQLAPLAPLLGEPNCRFYSLQVGELTDGEREIMQTHGIVDLAPFLKTFGDTGRVIERLDLLIAVDTGSAHLAGALNRPVWVPLAQACDPRWYDCQRFTPWYPSMRLYRQTELGDWTLPLADLRADLSRLSHHR
jgi:hypothetical protein